MVFLPITISLSPEVLPHSLGSVATNVLSGEITQPSFLYFLVSILQCLGLILALCKGSLLEVIGEHVSPGGQATLP